MSAVAVSFSIRADALVPICVASVGPVAKALALRVLRTDDETLKALRAVASEEVFLLLGPSESLPWVDGALYLGRDPEAPHLLLPTQRRPSVPVDALERAVLRRAQAAIPPIAVLLDPPRLVSVADARPIDRARLDAWLAKRA